MVKRRGGTFKKHTKGAQKGNDIREKTDKNLVRVRRR